MKPENSQTQCHTATVDGHKLPASELAANEPFYQAAVNAAKTRVHRAAASAGLSANEREDLYQEIMLDFYERAAQYDPTKGSFGTFTGMLSEHRTADYLTALNKQRSRMVRFSDRFAANDDSIDQPPAEELEDLKPMWTGDEDLFAESDALHDLKNAIAYMKEDQANLLNALAMHQDLPSAAKALGIPTTTFYRRVTDLQMHLRMFGIRSVA